jgi:hypothetical protein
MGIEALVIAPDPTASSDTHASGETQVERILIPPEKHHEHHETLSDTTTLLHQTASVISADSAEPGTPVSHPSESDNICDTRDPSPNPCGKDDCDVKTDLEVITVSTRKSTVHNGKSHPAVEEEASTHPAFPQFRGLSFEGRASLNILPVIGRRRNGQKQACEPCRKSKLSCSHTLPHCDRCIKAGKKTQCFYHEAPMTKGYVADRLGKPSPITSMDGSSPDTNAPTPPTTEPPNGEGKGESKPNTTLLGSSAPKKNPGAYLYDKRAQLRMQIHACANAIDIFRPEGTQNVSEQSILDSSQMLTFAR